MKAFHFMKHKKPKKKQRKSLFHAPTHNSKQRPIQIFKKKKQEKLPQETISASEYNYTMPEQAPAAKPAVFSPKRKKLFVRVGLIGAGCIAGIALICSISADRTPPTMRTTDASIPYGSELSFSELITATDNRSQQVTLSVIEPDSSLRIQDSSIVFTTPGTYKIQFEGTDDAGNTSEAAVSVTVYDDVSPVLTVPNDSRTISYQDVLTLNKTGKGSEVTLSYNVSDVSDTVVSFDSVKDENGLAADASAYTMLSDQELSFAKPGTYQLTLRAEDTYGNTATQQTQVTVTDPIAPVLNGLPSTIELNDTDSDYDFNAGVSALDEIDGAVEFIVDSSDIQFGVPGTYQVLYRAEDLSGNRTEQTVPVSIADTTPPQLTLTRSFFSLTVGDSAPDYASIASASDVADGDITVVVDSSAVDCSTPGTYTVTYTATDNSGNQSTQTATVKVTAPSSGSGSSGNLGSGNSGNGGSSENSGSITNSATVYVSRNGKYHSRSNCSGMKHYTEMSRKAAEAAGYQACKKCY